MASLQLAAVGDGARDLLRKVNRAVTLRLLPDTYPEAGRFDFQRLETAACRSGSSR